VAEVFNSSKARPGRLTAEAYAAFLKAAPAAKAKAAPVAKAIAPVKTIVKAAPVAKAHVRAAPVAKAIAPVKTIANAAPKPVKGSACEATSATAKAARKACLQIVARG